MLLTAAFLATTALAAPPNYEGHSVCVSTRCTYDSSVPGGKTTVYEHTPSGEHYFCEKSGAACVCHCHAAYKCTLRHHHTSGYQKSLHHCKAGATKSPTNAPTAHPTNFPTLSPTKTPCPTIDTTIASVNTLVNNVNTKDYSPVSLYDFSRGAGNTINFGGSTIAVNSNSCQTTAAGVKFCTYTKQAGHTNAHFEFSLPAGKSIKCSLLHNEDDIVYKSGTSAMYSLKMVTDGGNNCANTGTNAPCVKIYNNGASNDFIHAWQAYAVQCIENQVTAPAVVAGSSCATKTQNAVTAVNNVVAQVKTLNVIDTYDFSRGAGNTINFGGSTIAVNSNSCQTTAAGLKFCTYTKQAGHTNAHFEFSLPAGKSIKCSLLHNEDDVVYKSGTSAMYHLTMVTDGGNNCANTGTNAPCVKIYNNGASNDFIHAWQAYAVQCVGAKVAASTVTATGNIVTDEASVKSAVSAINSALVTTKQHQLYGFSRGAGNTISFGGSTIAVNSNSCQTTAAGLKFCTYTKQAGHSNAQFEFSLPAGKSMKCQLLHNEDDIVYKSGTSAMYHLTMVTDGGNNCANTGGNNCKTSAAGVKYCSGTNAPCVKLYNNGASTDFIHAWQAYYVSCLA